MPPSLTFIVLGFLLGMRHAMDPDHVVAVTTIVSRERTVSQAALIGALWGLGHTITIFLLGSAIILLKLPISATLGLSMELSVGLMLVLLGALNLTGVMRNAIEWLAARGYASSAHVHVIFGLLISHTHGGYKGLTVRETSGTRNQMSSWWTKPGLFHVLRPLVVGIVHGLAGSAAVALLVLATIKQPVWGVCYLLVFGLGTVLGMIIVTAAIALPFAYTAGFIGLNQGLAVASGLISVCFGLFLCYQISIGGLLTHHPNWRPQ